jgi:uncharacterized protein YfiM (DUF2279 family)
MISSPPQKLRWRRVLLWLVALLAVAAALGLSRTPAVQPYPPATASDALAMRTVLGRMNEVDSIGKPISLVLSWPEVDAATALARPSVGLQTLKVGRSGQQVVMTASRALPVGFWANLTVRVERSENGQPQFSGQLGGLPLPPPVMDVLFWTAQKLLDYRGIAVPHPKEIITDLKVSDAGVIAQFKMPPGSGWMQALTGRRLMQIDAKAVEKHYCRLAALEQKQPTPDFAAQVRRAFAGAEDEAQARLIALAMLTVSPQVGQLASVAGIGIDRCASNAASARLNDRLDLAKHWALSAALSSSLGTDASIAMGIWKEMSDSSLGGSGFSYADLAADRAGTMVAERLADPASAPAMYRWLATVTEAQLLPTGKLALAEGMSEADFTKRYDSVDSTRHKAVIARIDAALAASLPE